MLLLIGKTRYGGVESVYWNINKGCNMYALVFFVQRFYQDTLKKTQYEHDYGYIN